MQSALFRAEKLRFLGERANSGRVCLTFGGNENNESLETKFDSGMISLHVLSIP
jgi:hypothetical protein